MLKQFTRALCVIIPVFFFFNIADKVHAKPKKPKKSTAAESRCFFDFQSAPFYTSPDQRIGAKILIDSTKVGPTLVSMQNITFLPNAHIKSHRHVYVTEVVYVLKGNLVLRIGKETKVMGPDTTAYIPPQTFHEYLNDSGDVCQFLQFFSPSGPEEEYRNWEIPGKPEKPATTATPPIATESQVIRIPTAPLVPGTPLPIIGGIRKTEGPGQPAPAKDLTLKIDATRESLPATPTATIKPKIGSFSGNR